MCRFAEDMSQQTHCSSLHGDRKIVALASVVRFIAAINNPVFDLPAKDWETEVKPYLLSSLFFPFIHVWHKIDLLCGCPNLKEAMMTPLKYRLAPVQSFFDNVSHLFQPLSTSVLGFNSQSTHILHNIVHHLYVKLLVKQ